MGTWGVGPFDSDSAQDFLERVDWLPTRERPEFIAQTFRLALDEDQSASCQTVPEEVIAASALVAANVAAGEGLPWNGAVRGITGFLPRPVPIEVRMMAIDALEAVLPADGWWWTSWVDPTDQRRARAAHDAVKRALREG